VALPEWSEGENNMQIIKKLLGLAEPAQEEFTLRVEQIVHGGFGVYANAVVIAIHADRSAADDHCQRLLNQQAQG
jgi:hypothetical protein